MTAVQVEHLWKTFQIPHEKRTTLFENLAGILKPRQYETFTVLKDVNFEVERGECVGIIGDNGSGKSTLLKIIANILRPSKGTVRVEGKMTPFLELGVGFQADLTVRENIRVYATVMGLSRKEITDITNDVIEFAGLRKFEDTKLKNLSSGMQVRLAFSTAIQTEPDVLLVDEVLAVGDMEFQQKCFDVFNRYRKEGVTILFVSHDLGAVRRFCDRTLLLGGGEQRAFGGTSEILDRYVYNDRATGEQEIAEEKGSDLAGPMRWGDKKVAITDVQLLDKFGAEGTRFNSFDPMTIRIHYFAPSIISSPVFGIALYSEQDHHLYGTNTELKEVTIDHIDGPGYIDLKIERIPMLSGRFQLTVAVHTHEGKIYDWIDKQSSFEILPKGRDAGTFEIPCRWVT
jgi:lipopolysaccharide transport system ATP-binding protein